MSPTDQPALAPGSTVAVIGLGHIGGPMAANLVAGGYRVRGFDLAPEALAEAQAAGVEIAADVPRGGAGGRRPSSRRCRAGRSYSTSTEARTAWVANAGVGALLIDTSTIDVEEARTASREATEAGLLAVDAPLSGGVVGAKAGTLAFMVGGSAEAFERAQPLLAVLGSRAVHCGPPGSGQAVKLCNNMLLAIHQIGVAEAFALAQNLGVEAQAFYDVASVATGACWALTTNCPVPGPVDGSPSARGYEPGFAVSLMNKDLGLAISAAERTGTETELGHHAQRLYAAIGEGSDAGRDFSVVYRGIAERSGLEP
ncbi:MAG: 3-hydroxyisobutyrate dehydrogenase [Patulibacter minatonensis]